MPPNEEDLTAFGHWLAHYTTASTAFEHILPSGQLRMSPYRLMRDPAENKEGPSLATQLPNLPNASEALGSALVIASEVHQSARLASLTHDAMEYADGIHDVFGCAWARPRLWEQYADQHRGVCLVFHRPPFEDLVGKHLAAGTYYSGEVAYRPSGYAGSEGKKLTDRRIFDPRSTREAVLDHVQSHYEDFFFLKTDDWKSEHEYRVVVLDQKDDFSFIPIGGSVASVILGETFPSWQIPGALAACHAVGIPLMSIGWYGGRPVLHEVAEPQRVDDEELG
jgi:hypothetical protein